MRLLQLNSHLIFTIVINRSNLALAVSKTINKIILDREILVFSNMIYSSWLYSSPWKHHNIRTLQANVYYAESAYTCNDNHIIQLNYLEPSDYAHSSHLSHQNQRMGLNSHGTGTSSA